MATPVRVNRIGLEPQIYKGGKTTLCAGCGHNAISERIIDAFYEMGVEPSQVIKLSGIGCSSKSPAYFLGGSHDVKAGVQYTGQGSDQVNGPNDTYLTYTTSGRPTTGTTQLPYHQGANGRSIGTYVDDTYRIGSAVINVGVRYDYSRGSFPSFPLLDALGGPNRLDRLAGAGLRRVVVDRDARPLAAEGDRRPTADAARRAGDQGYLAVESHRRLPDELLVASC